MVFLASLLASKTLVKGLGDMFWGVGLVAAETGASTSTPFFPGPPLLLVLLDEGPAAATVELCCVCGETPPS